MWEIDGGRIMRKILRREMNDMEKYILVGVALDGYDREEASLDELAMLLDTAGGEAVLKVVQNLDRFDPQTYIGKGKAEEVKNCVDMYEATGIICDDELSPVQIRNLTDILGCKVIDRTILILDIFAAHASTNEGKIQVEMAQLKYRFSHLQGLGKSLSRQGGGIGTRGPGETKLETDRRRLQKRISALSHQISDMKRVRETMRKKRDNEGIPVLAIVGYTNAGKSTLLNRLTGASVLAEDKLFATLDPTTRYCRLPQGQHILFTDTVGFIHKLPHNLVDAFKSTLEEAGYADILLHVVDGADPEFELHMKTVYETLDELDIRGKKVITVFNKSDKYEQDSGIGYYLKDERAQKCVRISALSGKGIDELLEVIGDVVRDGYVLKKMMFSYDQVAQLERLKRTAQIVSQEYLEDGISVEVFIKED